MRRYKFILLMLVASLAWSCQRVDLESPEEHDGEISSSNVEVLEDGRIKVTTSLQRLGMTSIETRANSTEDNIYNGWCLVFGKTNGGTNITDPDAEGFGYGDDSPLIQIVPIKANTNGTFFMTFEPFGERAYMRIVTNMTGREDETLDKTIVSWQDIAASDTDLEETTTPTHSVVERYRDDPNFNLATFGQFRHQSVGLDGIYNIDYNTTAELKYYEKGFVDYSGKTVYYTVNYQNTDANRQTNGKNYLTKYSETYNGNTPNPSTQLNTTKGFPMASYGWVMDNLSEQTLEDAFGTTIDMIRVCSKVVVDATGSGFDMQEVYLIDAPQEARIRSTVLSTVSTDPNGDPSVTSSFSLPVDLGGLITYEAMPVSGSVSDPIYFYPNSGGDYSYTGAVDQGVNPQYIIIKGQAAGYDTPGYYKVALKAQYPLINGADPDQMDDTNQWSALTYDILRNTSFTVKITDVDKPGYKTFEDAADENSPANNISYSITIEVDNSRYETLVSKGTYHVELATSRVYAKGYGTEGIEGDNVYVDFTMYPTTGNTVPTVYVQSSDYDNDDDTDCVEITECKVLRDGEDAGYSTDDWGGVTAISPETNTYDDFANNIVVIPSSEKTTKVRVYFKATDSGRIRLRIGDILKFIPVVYEAKPIVIEGESSLTITDNYGTTWDNFAYNQDSDIEIALQKSGSTSNDNYAHRILQRDGSAVDNSGHYENLELHTRVYTSDNSGIAQLYLRQASDFNLFNNNTNKEALSSQAIVYKSTGYIYTITDGTPDTNVERSYTINGEVDFELTGDTKLTNFNQVGDIALGETFTFYGGIIGTNQDGNYVVANSHLSNSTTITLTNIANETATYTIAIDQYALPYVVETEYETVDGKMIFQGGTADVYGVSNNSNRRDTLNKIVVSNAYYTAVDNKGVADALGYHWESTEFKYYSISDLASTYENKNDNLSWFTSPAYDLGRVYYAIGIQHDEIDSNGKVQDPTSPSYIQTNRYQFYGVVNDKNSGLSNDGEGYFVLTIGNEANEYLHFYIYYKRDDNYI